MKQTGDRFGSGLLHWPESHGGETQPICNPAETRPPRPGLVSPPPPPPGDGEPGRGGRGVPRTELRLLSASL